MIRTLRAIQLWWSSLTDKGYYALCAMHAFGVYMMAIGIPLKNDLLMAIGGGLALLPIAYGVVTLFRN